LDYNAASKESVVRCMLLREWGGSEDRGERGIVLSFSFLELFRNRNIFFHFFFSDAVKVDGISSLTISPVLLNARDELGMVTGVVLFTAATREHMLWVSRLAEVLMAALVLLKTPSRSYLDPIV
jgi:hypothetical protein